MDVPAGALPSMAMSSASLREATCPTVRTPCAWSLRAVAGPTPQIRSTSSGWRKLSSRSAGTT
jgi:hypothetical protein